MCCWADQGRAVNRLPCDSMIRTGRPRSSTSELPGTAQQPGRPTAQKLDIKRRARPIQICRIDRRYPHDGVGAVRSRPRDA